MSDTIDSSHRRLELQALARDGHDDAASNGTGQTHADIGPALRSNLRRLRMRRGLSLERLSKQARVSRAMLSQIELGRSAPSVNIVWRIASALSVPWSALLSAHPDHAPRVLHAHKSQVIGNYDGSFSSRALFQREPRRGAEFYQLSIKPQGVGASPAYAPQSSANIALSEGSVRIKLGASILRLHAGDAAVFDADVEQIYENTGDTTAVLYLVISYACSDEG